MRTLRASRRCTEAVLLLLLPGAATPCHRFCRETLLVEACHHDDPLATRPAERSHLCTRAGGNDCTERQNTLHIRATEPHRPSLATPTRPSPRDHTRLGLSTLRPVPDALTTTCTNPCLDTSRPAQTFRGGPAPAAAGDPRGRATATLRRPRRRPPKPGAGAAGDENDASADDSVADGPPKAILGTKD